MTNRTAEYGKHQLNGRQLALFCAFVLPSLKLLDAPTVLSKYALGDLLLPAAAHYLLQALALLAVMLVVKNTGRGVFTLVKETLGNTVYKIFLVLFAAFFLLFSLQPILDTEKFIYVAFYDTAPSVFTFAPFFLLSGYIASKSLKSLGRFAELCFPILAVSLFFLFSASVGQADFKALLPLFELPFQPLKTAFLKTIPHFFDVALLLPLTEKYEYKKGDEIKAVGGYLLGGVLVLFFLATYFGIYQSIAPKEHFAIAKIAQYFPAFAIIGRADLVFVYLYTVVLFFATSVPILLATDCIFTAFPLKSRVVYAAPINFLLFLFALFFNKRYNKVTTFIYQLSPCFIVFSFLLPLLSLLFLLVFHKNKGAGKRFKQKTEEKE